MTLEYSQMPMNHGDGSAAVIVLFWGMNIHLYTRFCEHHFILMPLHRILHANLDKHTMFMPIFIPNVQPPPFFQVMS